LKRPPAHAPPARALNAGAWESLMSAYRTKKRGAPWIPPAASNETFTGLEADIADLARRGGITSWLFT
jgi:hypothetical protein